MADDDKQRNQCQLFDKTMTEEEIYDEIEYEDANEGMVAITHPFSPSDIKLSNPPMNLGDLIEMIDAGWINFGTEYQRAPDLWSKKKKSMLIESVLLGLRLPAFYFEEVDKRKWNIIDGLQRCCAIRDFCVEGNMELQGLEFLGDKFKDKCYSDLPFETRRDIKMLPITVNLLAKGVPDSVKYVLFKRLNTGGVDLTPQEIRNAVYHGKAIDVVRDMSKDSVFIRFFGNIKKDRCQDMDFVSRFIAFYVTDYQMYKPDMDSFINEAMELLKQDKVNVEQMKSDFHNSLKLCEMLFGLKNAFRKPLRDSERRGPINKAYFEVLATLFAKQFKHNGDLLVRNKDLLLMNLDTAMKANSYGSLFSGGTGAPYSVNKRFVATASILEQSMYGLKAKI